MNSHSELESKKIAQEEKQNNKIKIPENFNLPTAVVNHTLTFVDRKDYKNFIATCRFFRSVADDKFYNQLQAPPIDFKAFATRGLQKQDKITLDLVNDMLSTFIQLSNGNLVVGTATGHIYVWNITIGEVSAGFEYGHSRPTQLVEIAPNIIAVGWHFKNLIEFYNVNSNQQIIKLAAI